MYTPKKTADWERAAALLIRNAWRSAPLDEAVYVEVDAVFSRPKRLLRKKDPEGRMWHLGKPDIDNILKSTLDALVMAGVIRDDTQVCTVVGKKYWASKSEGPGLDVRMSLVDCGDRSR